jgi:hypothetical protein
MAQIAGYEAPQNLGLNPTEIGVDATAAAARRIGAFYNQKADALNDIGGRVASTVRDVGQVALDYMEHREISAGAAKYAEVQNNLTQKWNDIAKNADPNDPSVAAKFREEVANPALEQFRSGFNTERGQQFAEQKIDSLRQHMFEKTSADMSTLAGIAVRKNINDSATHMSNTAMLDPSSVPNLLSQVDHSISGVVGSSPTLSAMDAARATGELSDSTKKAIVQAGAIGAIQKAGNPEATADEWIKKYPDYISGAEAKTLASNARQQIRARNYDYETNRRRDKEITQDRSTEAANQYLIDVRSKDPRIAGDPTATKILNDPTLTKTDKNNLLNLIDRQLKPETDARLSQETFVGLLRQMRDPNADPDAVMQKAWDARLMDPGKAGSITEHDFDQFRAEVVARKTPEGAALERDRASFFKNYADAIVGKSGSYNPALGDPKVYNAEMDARRVENDLRKRGLDPHLAYDPASPYFLGNPKRISKWTSSMQQDLSTLAAPPSKNLTAGNSKITGMETKDLAIVKNADDYAKLPSGAYYTDPNGNLRTKR